MSDPRPSHCLHLDLPRGGNAAAQLNRVRSERSTGGINSTAAYSKANRDLSAMAAGSHSDHAPVSVELGRICGCDGTYDCEDGRQSESAPTIANHRSPHTLSVYTHPKRKGFKQSPLACGARYAVPPKGISTRTCSLMYQKRSDRFDCGVCGFAGKRRCCGIPFLQTPMTTTRLEALPQTRRFSSWFASFVSKEANENAAGMFHQGSALF
jgi:hypothetical protein